MAEIIQAIGWPHVTLIGVIIFSLFLALFKDFRAAIIEKIIGLKKAGKDGIEFEDKNLLKEKPIIEGLIKPEEKKEEEKEEERFKEESQQENLEQEDSTEVDLHFKMLEATYREKDITKVRAIYDEWMKLPKREMPEEAIEAQKYRAFETLGYDYLVSDLEKLENEKPDWFFPSNQLAEYYLKLNVVEKAKKHAALALERAKEPFDYSTAYNNYANVLLAKEGEKSAISYLETVVKEEKLKTAAVHVYEKIARIKESIQDTLGKHIALEKALEIDPSNKDIRFNLAYSYAAQADGKFLAVYHYNILLSIDPQNSTAMNNLAMLFDDLNIKSEKDIYLNKAAELHNDYGRGNTIIALAKAGFFKYAQQMLDSTPDKLKSGERMIIAAKYLKEELNKEEDRKKKANTVSKLHFKYVQRLCKGEFKELNIGNICGKWLEGNNATLKITQATNTGEVEGDYIIKAAFGDGKKFSIKGTIDNNILYIEANEIQENKESRRQSIATLLGGSWPPDKYTFYLFLESDSKIAGVKWLDELSPIEITMQKDS